MLDNLQVYFSKLLHELLLLGLELGRARVLLGAFSLFKFGLGEARALEPLRRLAVLFLQERLVVGELLLELLQRLFSAMEVGSFIIEDACVDRRRRETAARDAQTL